MVVKERQSLNLYADLQDVMFRPNTRAGVNDANRPQYCISSHERGYGFPRILLLGSPVNRGKGSLLVAELLYGCYLAETRLTYNGD